MSASSESSTSRTQVSWDIMNELLVDILTFTNIYDVIHSVHFIQCFTEFFAKILIFSLEFTKALASSILEKQYNKTLICNYSKIFIWIKV